MADEEFYSAVISKLQTEGAPQSKIEEFSTKLAQDREMSLPRMRRLATQYTVKPVEFSWDTPRTREGHYHHCGGLAAATKRAISYSPFVELLWVETGEPNIEQAKLLANIIHSSFPGKQLVYNLSPSFNWMSHGFDDQSLKSFIWDLAKYGYV